MKNLKTIALEISKDFKNTVEYHSGKPPALNKGTIVALQSERNLFHVEISDCDLKNDKIEGKVVTSKSTDPSLIGLKEDTVVNFKKENIFYITR